MRLPRPAVASMTALLALAASMLALAPSPAAAAAASIVSFSLDPLSATVGDRITMTIVVEHDASASLAPPGFGADFGGLEIIDIPVPRDDARGGTTRTTLTYTLAGFRTGDFVVPPQTIVVRNGDVSDKLETEQRVVTIRSVLAPGETDLRPLKPQIDIPLPAPSPLVPAGFIAMFAAITAFGYELHRRITAIRPPRVGAGPGDAPPSAGAAVCRELDAIAVSGLAQTDVAEYYARIAAAVRAYLSARFNFPAYAMTRRELEHEMRRASIDRWPARIAANLLEQCDAVEFAKFVPASGRRAADLTAAYEIVDLTTPHVADEAPAAPVSV